MFGCYGPSPDLAEMYMLEMALPACNVRLPGLFTSMETESLDNGHLPAISRPPNPSPGNPKILSESLVFPNRYITVELGVNKTSVTP